MYSDKVVEERIALVQMELGFQLEYHSPDEIDKFTRKLAQDETTDTAGNIILGRDLTQAEYRFIVNEYALCTCDAAYWLTRYVFISDENNDSVRFKFRGAQPCLFAVISELELKGAAIELLIAKARQQYVTTLTQLLALHRVLYHDYTYGVVASADASKSAEMAEKAFFTYDSLQWWIKPKHTRRVEGVPGLLKFDSIKTRLSILHGATSAKAKGKQKVGIARGSTPTVYSISEVAHFPDPEQTIEAALFGGVHASPKILGFLESTFAGEDDWFAMRYKTSKVGFDKGLSRSRALFFNWPFAKEIYPTPTWWKTHRQYMPPRWKPEGKVAEQILKAELFIQSSPLLATHMGKNWRMPIEQQWYYHFRYTEAERNGTLNTLIQELSCDDQESMISSYDNVFGRDVIHVCHRNRDRDFDVYGIVGTAIDSKFDPDPDDIDYSRNRVILRHEPPRNDAKYEWELIPLKYELFEDIAQLDPSDPEHSEKIKDYRPLADSKLFIFRDAMKEDTFETSLGIDTSTGISADSSVIAGSTKGNGNVPDIQIAEFRSELVNHVEAFAFAMPIALYLRMLNRNPNEILRWPWCGIEQIAAVGDTCQVQLRRMGYPTGRFFKFGRYDSVQMNHKSSQKVGWYTVKWSRDLLLGYFVHAVKNGWYKLNSPWTIDECRTFEVHTTASGKSDKMEHSSTSHDDGIFGNAIATFINHDYDTLADRGNKTLMPKSENDPPEISILPAGLYKVNPDTRISQISIDSLLGNQEDVHRYKF